MPIQSDDLETGLAMFEIGTIPVLHSPSLHQPIIYLVGSYRTREGYGQSPRTTFREELWRGDFPTDRERAHYDAYMELVVRLQKVFN